jgi:hypothetical protein
MIPSKENGFALAFRIGTHASALLLVISSFRSTIDRDIGKGHNTIEDYFSDIVIRGPHWHIR